MHCLHSKFKLIGCSSSKPPSSNDPPCSLRLLMGESVMADACLVRLIPPNSKIETNERYIYVMRIYHRLLGAYESTHETTDVWENCMKYNQRYRPVGTKLILRGAETSLRRRPNSKRRRIGSAYNGAISCSRDFNLFRLLGTRQRVSCMISASFCEREEK